MGGQPGLCGSSWNSASRKIFQELFSTHGFLGAAGWEGDVSDVGIIQQLWDLGSFPKDVWDRIPAAQMRSRGIVWDGNFTDGLCLVEAGLCDTSSLTSKKREKRDHRGMVWVGRGLNPPQSHPWDTSRCPRVSQCPA